MVENRIHRIDRNVFKSSFVKKLFLSIKNISIENVCNLTSTMKPKKIKDYLWYEYFDPFYIENRDDVDFIKTYV